MAHTSVKKDIGDKLPYEIFLPDQNGDKAEVEIDSGAHRQLEKKEHPHDDHQFFNDRCQTIPKRKTVAIVSHLKSSVSSKS